MILIRAVAIGLYLFAHYLIWTNTTSWQEFLLYCVAVNIFGFIFGVLSVLKLNKEIKKLIIEK